MSPFSPGSSFYVWYSSGEHGARESAWAMALVIFLVSHLLLCTAVQSEADHRSIGQRWEDPPCLGPWKAVLGNLGKC